MRLLGALLAIVALARCSEQQKFTVNSENVRKTGPVGGATGKTRLLKIEYSFRGESMIYDVMDNKPESPSTVVEGRYMFETLHHDDGGHMLVRISQLECKTDNCGRTPPVYLDVVQGGNNIMGVHMEESDLSAGAPTWNWLFGVINTVYTPAENGEGDEQWVPTVYGRCRVHFGRPEDKKFRRVIDTCELGDAARNYTAVDGLTIASYKQDAWYTQNTKTDADIIIIDGVEQLELHSPTDERWGWHVESRVHMELENRTRLYVEKNCEYDIPVAECAERAFSARRISERVYEGIQLAGVNQRNSLSSLISQYRNHLFEMGDRETCPLHASLYAQITQAAQSASSDELSAIIRDPENDVILPTIGNVLGQLGTVEALKIAREVYLVEAPDHLSDLLFGVAHSLSLNDKWMKQMMYWLGDEAKASDKPSPTYWSLANTVGHLMGRRCAASTSAANACAKNKDKMVLKFVSDLHAAVKCEKCRIKNLEVLLNVPIPSTYQHAKKLLCKGASQAEQTAALALIERASAKNYDSQLVQLLVKIFRNTCPQKASIVERQLATDILLKSLPQFQNAATLLLRTEALSMYDEQAWAYFYSALNASRHDDEIKDEFWSRMRAFRVFRPNYNAQAVRGHSHMDSREMGVLGPFSSRLHSSAVFADSVLKRARVSLEAYRGRKTVLPLAELTLSTSSFSLSPSEEGALVPTATPAAAARIAILGYSLPTTSLFSSQEELRSALWNADGQSIKAFEASILLRSFSSSFPLLSGLTVEATATAAVSLKLLASASHSAFHRELAGRMDLNSSLALSTSVSLIHPAVSLTPVRTLSARQAKVASHSVLLDAAFHENEKAQYCQRVELGDSVYSLFTSTSDSTPRTRTITQRGHTLRPHGRLDCSWLAHRELPEMATPTQTTPPQ